MPLIVMLFFQSAISQDSLVVLRYPSEKEINLQVYSNIVSSDQGLEYQYELNNLHSSSQKVWRFSLALIESVEESKSPEGWEGRITPIPFLRISWGSTDIAYDLSQGKRLKGFSFNSKGVPSINDFYATGWIEPLTFEIEPDSIIGGVFPENSFHGKTIGPRTILPTVSYIDFVDSIISYTNQSVELNWLGKEQDEDCDNDERIENGIVRNIERRLRKAKHELTRGDSVQAREVLKNLVQKVERIWKRSQESEKREKRNNWDRPDKIIMTSEAYALLKYNVGYLVDHLPGKRDHRRK